MALELTVSSLWSRIARSNVLSGKTGSNLFDPVSSPLVKPRKLSFSQLTRAGKEGGIIKTLFGLGKLVAGWLLKGINFLVFSAQTIWAWIVGAVERIKAFDWNASDKALTASMQTQNIRIAALWGGVVGNAVGWLGSVAVGYGIGLALPVIGGSLLANTIALKTLQEGVEDFLPLLRNAIFQMFGVWTRNALTTGYINLRRWIKSADQKFLEQYLGKDTAKWIKEEWGKEGGPVISFNKKMDDELEKIPDKALRAFLEEFYEEAWDSFIEGGFVVANEIDTAYAQARLAQQNSMGTARTVSILPDKENDNEVLTFEKVPQNLLIPAVQQTVNTHRLLDNRDVGQFVGELVEDYARKMPLGLRMKITLYSVDTPPYSARRGKLKRVSVSIPDVKRSAVDWAKIKEACGGNTGYMWGRFKATAQLSNGRPFSVYGATADVAEKQMRRFLALSTAEIVTWAVTEEKKEGARLENPQLYKEATRVYPAYVSIVNRDLQQAVDRGKPTKKGNYRDRDERIELWTIAKPYNFEQIVTDLLRKVPL